MSRVEPAAVIAVPELTPSLLPILRLLGGAPAEPFAGMPVLGRATWPSLRSRATGLVDPNWRSLPDSVLWQIHDTGMAGDSGPSLLELKTELSIRLADPCRICTIRCGAQRQQGEVGVCGAGASSSTRIWRERVLVHEEPFLGNGWAIDPSGCNANCVYCHSARGIAGRAGRVMRAENVAAVIDAQTDIDHINIVGGESTVHLPWIMQVLGAVSRDDLPLVLTTNGTATAEVARVLSGVVSAYLVSARLTDTCAPAHGDVGHTAPLKFVRAVGDGSTLVVVRLLAIPGHIHCCAINWIVALEALAAYGIDFWVSPMFGYLPSHRARRMPELRDPLSASDVAAVQTRLATSSLRLLHTDPRMAIAQ